VDAYEGRRFFAVANSTRKIGIVIFQRRRVIAPSIAPGRIFLQQTVAAGFRREKKALAKEFPG